MLDRNACLATNALPDNHRPPTGRARRQVREPNRVAARPP
jgi:hypothetical protein